MHEPFLAGQDLDEGAELLDGGHAAFVDLADAHLGGHRLEVLDAGHDLLGVDARDGAQAAVLDADLDLEVLLHRPDVLAGRADDEADLLLRDRHRFEARRVRAELRARLTQDLEHLAQHVQTALARLLEGLAQDLPRQAVALDVHLQGRDAAAGADDLEVHVAARVLAAEDVGQDRILAAFHDEAHRDARHGLLDRHAGIHHRQRRGARGRHRRAAVRLQDLARDADRVGELFARGQDRLDAALSQRAVADLAAARRTRALDLADAERREVVVQQEALLLLRHQAVDDLLVIDAAERDDAQGLGLAAREQDRAVHARQHTDLDRDRADRSVVAAIGAAAAQDRLALALLDDAADDLADRLAPLDLLGVRAAGRGRERGSRGFLRRLDRGAAGLLAARRQRRRTQLLAELRLDGGDELLVALGRRELHLGAAGLLAQLLDELGDLARRLVAQLQRLEHHLLGDLLGARFDHHDGVLAARDGQVELVVGRLDLAPERVDHELAVAQADAAHAQGRAVRDRAERQRGEARDRGDDVRVVLAVRRQHLRQHLHLGLVAVREHRPHAAVDEAAAQDLLGRRPSFALEEAARDHAGGRRLLAVVDRQRKEIDVVAGLLALRRRQHHRVAVAHDDGAVGLARHAAGLERQLAAADLTLDADRLGDRHADGATRLLRRRRCGRLGLRGVLAGPRRRLAGARLARGAGAAALGGALRSGAGIILLLACHDLRLQIAARGRFVLDCLAWRAPPPGASAPGLGLGPRGAGVRIADSGPAVSRMRALLALQIRMGLRVGCSDSRRLAPAQRGRDSASERDERVDGFVPH